MRKHLTPLSVRRQAERANYVDIGILLLDFIRVATLLDSEYQLDFGAVFKKSENEMA